MLVSIEIPNRFVIADHVELQVRNKTEVTQPRFLPMSVVAAPVHPRTRLHDRPADGNSVTKDFIGEIHDVLPELARLQPLNDGACVGKCDAWNVRRLESW